MPCVRLKQRFGDKITGSNLEAIDPWIENLARLAPPGVQVSSSPRAEPRFNMLQCITPVDFLSGRERRRSQKTASGNALSLVERAHSRVAGVEGNAARWKDDVAGELPRDSTVSGDNCRRPWYCNAKLYDLSGVRIMASQLVVDFCARRIGSAYRCEKTMGYRWNISRHPQSIGLSVAPWSVVRCQLRGGFCCGTTLRLMCIDWRRISADRGVGHWAAPARRWRDTVGKQLVRAAI